MQTKKKSNPKGRYIIHSNHERLPIEKHVMQYIAFDPGEDNFDIRIEQRYMSQFGEYCALIKTIKQTREKIVYQRSKSGTGTKSISTQCVIDILNKLSKYLDKTDIVLIEGQMNVNNTMMHLQYTIISYFLITKPHIFVAEISSKLKTINLGNPPKMSYYKTKKWGERKAIELAKIREDKKFIKYIESLDKIDDSTDNYIQIEGFCVEACYQNTCLHVL